MFTVSANLWLAAWSSDAAASTDAGTRNFYLAVYGALGFLESLSVLVAVLAVTVGSLRASAQLHRQSCCKFTI